MATNEPITLSRECEVIGIPNGVRDVLPAGSVIKLVQSLGGGYTVTSERGYLYRIDGRDADAIGLASPTETQPAARQTPFSEAMVWEQLKSVYDPEIPVNIVDLGLIYSCAITPVAEGENRIEIKMSMTAPGCGMGNVLKADVESRLSRLPSVKQVTVEVVFEPPWHPGRMSEAAKLQLGFDLDLEAPPSALPVFRSGR